MIHVAQQGRAASQEVLAKVLQGVLHLRPQPIQGEQGMFYFLDTFSFLPAATFGAVRSSRGGIWQTLGSN